MASKLADFAKALGTKKPSAVGKLSPDGDPAVDDEPDVTPSADEVAVAKELLAALKKGDPTAVAMALKNFIQET